MSIRRATWRQIGGDMNPGKYSGIIARFDGEAVETRNIQPVREYVGDKEAKEVGFPFWTTEGYYDPEDLSLDNSDMRNAMKFVGMEEEDLPTKKDDRMLALAEIAHSYGYRVEPGPSGWSEDVVPDGVHWATGEVMDSEYLSDEDEDFRNEILTITLRETYEIITEESAAEGDVADRGWIDEEGSEYTLGEAVDLLEGTEPSSSEFHPGIWYTLYEYEKDYDDQGMVVENRSYHVDEKTTSEELQELLYKKVTGKDK